MFRWSKILFLELFYRHQKRNRCLVAFYDAVISYFYVLVGVEVGCGFRR